MLAASPAAPAAPLPKNLAPLRFSGALFVFRAHLYQNTAASPFLQERCRANWVRGRKSVVLLAQVLFQTCPQFYILHFTFYTYHFILIEPFRTRPPCLPPRGKVSRVVLRRATKEGHSPLYLLAAPPASSSCAPLPLRKAKDGAPCGAPISYNKIKRYFLLFPVPAIGAQLAGRQPRRGDHVV